MNNCTEHDWTVWSVPFSVQVTIQAGSFGDVAKKLETRQNRFCSTCKIVESREVFDGVPLADTPKKRGWF